MSDKQNNHIKTVGLIMIITFVGKAMALVRDMLLGFNFATGVESNAFSIASQIPRNFFDAVFASAISASFIPIFNTTMEKDGKEEAFRLSRAFFTWMGLLTALLSVVGMAFAGPLTTLFADGFDQQTAALCTSLLRILFPTVFFTGIAFSMVGILQSMGEFNIPAAMSIVSNGVVIIYYLFFCKRFGIYGLAVAFLIAWGMQAAIQVPSLHKFGFRYRPALAHPGLKKIFSLMLPVMISTWIQPINQAVSTRFASYLFEGAGVSAMNYANNLYTLLAGILVLSITNVIFPEMSRLSAHNQTQELGKLISSTLRGMLFLLLPMTVGLMLLATPLIQLLYQHGTWGDYSTQITSRALVFLALGMIGYGIQNVLSRAFYAEQSGKVPMISGLISIAVNLILCMVLSPIWDVAGLALATAISSTVSALVLLIPINRKLKGMLDKSFWLGILRMAVCAAIMGGAVWLVQQLLAGVLPGGMIGKLLAVLAPTAVGIVVYFLAALVLRVPEVQQLKSILQRFTRKGGH